MVKLSALKGIRGQYRLRVRYRLLVLEYATLHGPTAAARRYGVCPRTVCRWRRRWRAEGLAGLTPRYPRQRPSRLRPEVLGHIHHARETLHYGAARTRLWLLRVHQVRLAMGTIQRVFRALGLPYLRRTRKRAPRQLKLFEKAEPGESVQVDVKFVRIAGRWAFQYTALDDCTRFRVLRLYRHLHRGSSLAFLAELRRAFPFRIRRLQCDNGQEFPSSRWPSRRRGSAIGTSARADLNRTARSSAAIVSTTRSSGAGRPSPTSTPPVSPCAGGKPPTTTSASRSR
jgi:transposase